LGLPKQNVEVADMFNSEMLHCTYDPNNKLNIQEKYTAFFVFMSDLTACSQGETPVNNQLILPKRIIYYHQPQIRRFNI
jgi:hypothetical protein